MKNLIETLKSSNNIFLKVEGDFIEKWKNLLHTKEGLDLFLQFNIAEILYGKEKHVCTSNVELVNRILKILGIDKTLNSSAFSSKRNISMAWDMEKNKIVSFSMKNKWTVSNFIPINPSNIGLLQTILEEVLTKSKKTK